MTPLPLDQIGFGWRSHRSALWWLGLLYRRPVQFREAVKQMSQGEGERTGLILFLHAVPWMFIVCAFGRLLLFGALDLALDLPPDDRSSALEDLPVEVWSPDTSALSWHICEIAFGIGVGLAIGIISGNLIEFDGRIGGGVGGLTAVGIAFGAGCGWFCGIDCGIAVGSVLATGLGIFCWIARRTNDGKSGANGGGIAFGIVVAIVFGIDLGSSRGLAFRPILRLQFGIGGWLALGIGGGLAFTIYHGRAVKIIDGIGVGLGLGICSGIYRGIIDGFAVGISSGISGGIVIGMALLRAYYQPIHLFLFLVWPRALARWYPYHPVAWDDNCSLPFPRLDRLLLAYADHDPAAAAAEIERLITSYPSQRESALKARVALIARQAGRETDLTRLPLSVDRLPEGEEGFLAQTRRVGELVVEISQKQVRLNATERLQVRQRVAEELCEKIENFQYKVSGLAEPLASEFRAAAQRWLVLAEQQRDGIKGLMSSEAVPLWFRAGDPVNRDQEAFILRDSVVGELQQQVLLSTGCPGVLLYGRRRTGKSTVLLNLSGFLPETVSVAYLSVETAKAFTSLEHFVVHLAQQIQAAWPGAAVPAIAVPRDLPALMDFLDTCNRQVAQAGQRLLVALDEYEAIDQKIGEGVFSSDLLATIRHSIQTHRQLTWVFAGSHGIGELTHAAWSSYLVSLRTIEVLPFTLAETRLLLTDPLNHSTLWQHKADRPTYPTAFWGEGGIERIHGEAGGWPHLVQLIAENVINLLNFAGARSVTPDLLERALATAVVRGDVVLRRLLADECRLPGEWDYLKGFRTRDTQPPPDDEAVYQSLRRRLLVAVENGEWRLRVPLMQRWLRERY